jgi:hypothetical protein
MVESTTTTASAKTTWCGEFEKAIHLGKRPGERDNMNLRSSRSHTCAAAFAVSIAEIIQLPHPAILNRYMVKSFRMRGNKTKLQQAMKLSNDLFWKI